jgi:hypothetical protein
MGSSIKKKMYFLGVFMSGNLMDVSGTRGCIKGLSSFPHRREAQPNILKTTENKVHEK